MALVTILERGIEAAIQDGQEDLRRHIAEQGLAAELAPEALVAIRTLPRLLHALDDRFRDPSTTLTERALLPVVFTYLWEQNNLVPAAPPTLLLGLLDDAYLVMRVANEFQPDMNLSAELRTARSLLPENVVRELDRRVHETITAVIAKSEQQGG